MSLADYHKKRNFSKTTEPKGKIGKGENIFVVQKHHARQLHYDFRLALDGVLKSFAVPKGPSLDAKIKRAAFETEDHPLDYATFEGQIPKGLYGAGSVIVWDKGYWESLDEEPLKAYEKGHLRFNLDGEKLKGRWDLFKIDAKKTWILKKYADAFAQASGQTEIVEEKPASVMSGLKIEDLEAANDLLSDKKIEKLLSSLAKSPFPSHISPQLATLSTKAPEGDAWIHEVKLDGYRMLAFKKGNKVSILSRNQRDWTEVFEAIAEEVKKLPVDNLILDGEVVSLDEHNRSSFQLLQNSIELHRASPLLYYVFDLIFYKNRDLRELDLLDRKEILKTLISDRTPTIVYSNHIRGEGTAVFEACCQQNLEGIVSKLASSTYASKRTKSWLKVKCTKRQEFVIGGYTPPQKSRQHFGSLYLGVYNAQNALVYCGNVGTGFSDDSLKSVYEALLQRKTDKNPFNSNPPGFKTAIFVKPELVAEVEFSEWTQDASLRHPSFKGLRLDKQAKTIHRETGIAPAPAKKSRVILTNPQKVLYEEDQITKADLFDYYLEAGDFMYPFIKERPLTLVRCPNNYQSCFYQKHYKQSKNKHVIPTPVQSKKDGQVDAYITVDDKEGLLELVQMGVLEIHPWGSRIGKLDYPDMLIFDLDPDIDLSWDKVVHAAFEVKQYLEAIGLQSFVKTTGGKGLHLVCPIKAEHAWPEIKRFTKGFVETLEKMHPQSYVANMAKQKRQGKIFIDYLRNQWESTAIGAYSPRARLHAPVAVPLAWEELSEKAEDCYFTIKTLPARLKNLKKDPWEGFWSLNQFLKIEI